MYSRSVEVTEINKEVECAFPVYLGYVQALNFGFGSSQYLLLYQLPPKIFTHIKRSYK